VALLYPTAEEARITCAIVDAAVRVGDVNRAGEGAAPHWICEMPAGGLLSARLP